MEGEVFVGARKSRDEVIFPGAYGTFRCISSMDVGRCKLEVNLLLAHVFLQFVRCFVVEAL